MIKKILFHLTFFYSSFIHSQHVDTFSTIRTSDIENLENDDQEQIILNSNKENSFKLISINQKNKSILNKTDINKIRKPRLSITSINLSDDLINKYISQNTPIYQQNIELTSQALFFGLPLNLKYVYTNQLASSNTYHFNNFQIQIDVDKLLNSYKNTIDSLSKNNFNYDTVVMNNLIEKQIKSQLGKSLNQYQNEFPSLLKQINQVIEYENYLRDPQNIAINNRNKKLLKEFNNGNEIPGFNKDSALIKVVEFNKIKKKYDSLMQIKKLRVLKPIYEKAKSKIQKPSDAASVLKDPNMGMMRLLESNKLNKLEKFIFNFRKIGIGQSTVNHSLLTLNNFQINGLNIELKRPLDIFIIAGLKFQPNFLTSNQLQLRQSNSINPYGAGFEFNTSENSKLKISYYHIVESSNQVTNKNKLNDILSIKNTLTIKKCNILSLEAARSQLYIENNYLGDVKLFGTYKMLENIAFLLSNELTLKNFKLKFNTGYAGDSYFSLGNVYLQPNFNIQEITQIKLFKKIDWQQNIEYRNNLKVQTNLYSLRIFNDIGFNVSDAVNLNFNHNYQRSVNTISTSANTTNYHLLSSTITHTYIKEKFQNVLMTSGQFDWNRLSTKELDILNTKSLQILMSNSSTINKVNLQISSMLNYQLESHYAFSQIQSNINYKLTKKITLSNSAQITSISNLLQRWNAAMGIKFNYPFVKFSTLISYTQNVRTAAGKHQLTIDLRSSFNLVDLFKKKQIN